MSRSRITSQCPRGTIVQSVMFSRAYFRNVASARQWLRAHGFTSPKVDRTPNYLRFRQVPPSRFVKGTFRTITFRAGVKAVVGCPKAGSFGRRRNRARGNPDLLILSNPDAPSVPESWARFHLRDTSNARMVHIPDVPGVPKSVVALGGFEGVEVEDSHGRIVKVLTKWSERDGPWLVTDAKMKRLWVVARTQAALSKLRPYIGVRSAAVYYFPPATSGKHDRDRGFRHAWGDGTLPRSRWPEAWPKLGRMRSSRAVEFVGGQFTIEPDGIVG
jgi:hypothetical protein